MIVLFSPLRCAQLVGIRARRELLDRPTVTAVRILCAGKLFATVNFKSATEATSFPMVIAHGAVTVRVEDSSLTELPTVDSKWDGFSYQTTCGYSAVFTFNIPEAWTDETTLRYVVPEKGGPEDVAINLAIFAQDVRTYRN